jgi:hypothetical protein
MPDASRRGDPLADLRERLDATRRAAERVADEAAEAAGRAGRGEDPGPGWRTAAEREALRDDVGALVTTIGSLADLLPDELRAQLAEVVRELLLLLRAIIDLVVDRLAPERRPAPAVQDIPLR